MSFILNITEAYKRVYVLYLRQALVAKELEAGSITVIVKDVDDFSAEGSLNSQGSLSGMASVYEKLNLQPGNVVNYIAVNSHTISIINIQKAERSPFTEPVEAISEARDTNQKNGVFSEKKLNHIHIEMFTPENLRRWNPENEPDVYMVFGLLQAYTKYRYCCATSKSLLDKLGYTADSKPDAILVDDTTKEYLIAEFKMKSSAFKSNHKKEDIDVLIVWDDDELEKWTLPSTVLCLRDIARTVAMSVIRE